MNEPLQDGIVNDADLDDVMAEADAAYATTSEVAEPAPATEPATQAAGVAPPTNSTKAAPAVPDTTSAQAGPPWWQNVKDYTTFETALASAPPEMRAMLDHMADAVFKPHYQDLTAALERTDAAAKQWESLLAEAKTKGVDVAAAERVQKLTADIETAQQAVQAAEAKVTAYGHEYSAVVRDSFIAMCPDFKPNTPIGQAFQASVAARHHQKYMQAGASEATALARLWRDMVPAAAQPPATSPPAAPVLPSAARIANASRGSRPAAPSVRTPQQMSEDDIFAEADSAYPIGR